ncbi:1,4-alpha-glucan branching protein [Streptomyces sp. NPDC060209]|uniref:maltokinase N-terminal cap-like domain-containing protein n=1 Tax=Streptomyces sp. NPDC060209 TaxID=3347073 RepID=UPI00365B14EE
MAVIHRTTMEPGKLQLLAAWLPSRPWYRGTGAPELTRAGGFRLDDPEGDVGIEFMVVTDTSGDGPVAYHVPVTYRGAPLDGAGEALVGTSEHGVLGRRWVYDGAHDPVLVAQLLALLHGQTEPQAQSLSDTPDPSVAVSPAPAGPTAVDASVPVHEGKHSTAVVLDTEAGEGAAAPVTLEVRRVLLPEDSGAGDADADADVLGHVTAGWSLPGGEEIRGRFAVLARGPR